MKVIICGAGQVGWQIARHLSGEDNDVTVVDNNEELVARAINTLDVQGIAGFASYPNVLERAGAYDADLIIAATHSDEVNMVTCQVAHSVFSVSRKIARLRTQSYLDAISSDLYRRDHLPIDVVISPEIEVAEAALLRLATPSAFDTELFLDGQAQILGLRLTSDCPVLNTPLRQLTDLFSTLRVVVVAIRRDGRLFAPEADDQLFAGDECHLFAPVSDIPRTLKIFGKEQKKQERLVIIGAGNVGLSVAHALEHKHTRQRVKIVERNRKIAERAADALERTIVLHGDGLESTLQREAGVARADAVLCVTDDDKTNMLAAVRAKSEGCPMTISLVNDPTLVQLLEPMGIDAHINPRASTVSSILRHIRLGRVRAVYSIGDAEAEVVEADVMQTSALAGKMIRDIDFPEGVLVAGVRKGEELIKPHGKLLIEAGNTVVLFAMANDVVTVQQLLQVSINFF